MGSKNRNRKERKKKNPPANASNSSHHSIGNDKETDMTCFLCNSTDKIIASTTFHNHPICIGCQEKKQKERLSLSVNALSPLFWPSTKLGSLDHLRAYKEYELAYRYPCNCVKGELNKTHNLEDATINQLEKNIEPNTMPNVIQIVNQLNKIADIAECESIHGPLPNISCAKFHRDLAQELSDTPELGKTFLLKLTAQNNIPNLKTFRTKFGKAKENIHNEKLRESILELLVSYKLITLGVNS
ncbi:unnamed protein product [Rhizophagus irregularis]|uniref:Uncharacterized protein n=1 Tax=Rhizophagus irregularis TaxID=588596 RepID=A0A2I1EXF1_9GLOM|nr:hypothetical protein RhiirB3_442237 [Rhizophagus irregularis]CAB5383380.1 unnamed protein product [Rhizophagus irregularis]